MQRGPYLPEHLTARLAALSSGTDAAGVAQAVRDLGELPARLAPVAAWGIVEAAGLRHGRGVWPLFDRTQAWLKRNPDGAWLYTFHADGHLRQAALQAIASPPATPFWFAGLTWRLNDWVPQVRKAALACAMRVLPQAEAEVAAQAALFLLDRRFVRGRWDEAGRHILDLTIDRAAVISHLVDHGCQATSGPTGRLLSYLGRYPALDQHLPRLARDAVQPTVRATAYRWLLGGEVAWPVGYRWVWIDKSYNKRRHVPDLASRPLAVEVSREAVIVEAASDASPIVRSRAADALMDLQRPVARREALVHALAQDRSGKVRARAEFLLRQSDGVNSR